MQFFYLQLQLYLILWGKYYILCFHFFFLIYLFIILIEQERKSERIFFVILIITYNNYKEKLLLLCFIFFLCASSPRTLIHMNNIKCICAACINYNHIFMYVCAPIRLILVRVHKFMSASTKSSRCFSSCEVLPSRFNQSHQLFQRFFGLNNPFWCHKTLILISTRDSISPNSSLNLTCYET